MTDKSRYGRRGVSSSKQDVHKAIEKLDRGLFPGAFCKLVPDYLTGDPGYCLAMHADGAGTKSSLAYAYWKETGDLSVWKGIARDAVVMNLDDLICVGATDNILLSSVIGRNKNKVPGEVVEAVVEGTREFIEKMQGYGINMVLTGGETADVGDLVRTVIVDCTAVCRMKRSDVLVNRIRPGDVVIGLASWGQAEYEDSYNGGMGSNGLASARHDIFSAEVGKKYPESYDPAVPKELVYTGSYGLTRKVPGLPVDAGRLVLSPTRTYAPVIREILRTVRGDIHGMIHCTGGGQTKVLNFVRNVHVIKDSLFDPPPLFRMIREESGQSWEEMYRVFNMGHRMELYAGPDAAEKIIQISSGYKVDAKVVGHCESHNGEKLTIVNPQGSYIYP